MSGHDDALRERLTEVIRSVTDLWDEPLDEVHDVPQIATALLPVLADVRAEAAQEAPVVEEWGVRWERVDGLADVTHYETRTDCSTALVSSAFAGEIVRRTRVVLVTEWAAVNDCADRIGGEQR